MPFSNFFKLTACFLLLTGLILSMPLAALTAPPLKAACDNNYPPFSYTDDHGHPAGFDVEITKALCKEMQMDCEIVFMHFDEIIPAMTNSTIDFAAAGMAMTPQRQKLVNFTDHYYRSRSIFIEKKGNLTGLSPADVKGKRAGAQLGTVHEQYLRTTYGDAIKVLPQEIFEDLFRDLQEGRLDFILVESLTGYSLLKTDLGKGLEAFGGPSAFDETAQSTNSYIIVDKKNPQLLEKLNLALQAILRSGEYNRISNKYFDFNIY